jgi:hypothetical protein
MSSFENTFYRKFYPLPLTGGPTCHKSPTKTVLPDDERVVTIFSTFENTFGDFGFLFSPGRSLPAPCTHIFILEGVVALFTRLVYPHFHFGRFYILPPNTHISFPPWLMVSIICFLSFPWLIVSFKVLGFYWSIGNLFVRCWCTEERTMSSIVCGI